MESSEFTELEWKSEFNKWMLNYRDVYAYHHTHVDYLSDTYTSLEPRAAADLLYKSVVSHSPYFHSMQEVDGVLALREGETWATSAKMMKDSFLDFCGKIVRYYEHVRRLVGISHEVEERERSDDYIGMHWEEIYEDCIQYHLSSAGYYGPLKRFVAEANNRSATSESIPTPYVPRSWIHECKSCKKIFKTLGGKRSHLTRSHDHLVG